MDKSVVPTGAEVSRVPKAARLRMRGASSQCRTWRFAERHEGTTISVGAQAQCDWCIEAEGIAPVEVFIHFNGRGVFARSAHASATARLDGVPLSSDWARIEHGSKLEIGAACIEAFIPPHMRRKAPPVQASVQEPVRHAEAVRSVAELHATLAASQADAPQAVPSFLADDVSVAPPIVWWRVFAVGAVTAIAYAAWVFLLDRL